MTSLTAQTSGIGKVFVGDRFSGTAFRVGADHLLTSFHAVGRRETGELYAGKITVVLRAPDGAEAPWPASPSPHRDPLRDWILLEIKGLDERVPVLPLGPLANANVPFEVYGFPPFQPVDGLLLAGVVRNHRATFTGVPAVQLYVAEAAAGMGPSLEGASGSPVYVGGHVVALLRDVIGTGAQAVAGTVYATSVEPAARALGIWPDHCTGLPPLPPLPYPEAPFPGLLPFTRAHARVLFGRCAELQRLWGLLTGPNAPYLVILSGESGVGKSSLLDAGLLPRLEHAGWKTHYQRRPPGGFDAALLPAAAGPAVLVLDQVEEIWTRPRSDIDEPGELLAALLHLQRPDLRVILGLRREWYTTLRARVAALAGVPWAPVDLWRLDEAAIVESITGVTTDQELRQRYPLSISPRLADRMALDLLADPAAPLAPLLQIQLAAMWEAARGTPRIFDEPLYRAVRDRSGALPRFLATQLDSLPDAASRSSGLALDLLLEHVSAFGTAANLSVVERRTRYGERAEKLVEDLKARRLLADADDGSRLAHDTLAPVVREAWQTMATPGARARALLESRVTLGRDLDPGDLPTIEAGLPGMRTPRETETALLNASRDAQRQGRILRGVVQGVLLGLLLTVAVTLIFWNRTATERQQQAGRAALAIAETFCASIQEGARSAGIREIEEAALMGVTDGVGTALARCLARAGLDALPEGVAPPLAGADARVKLTRDPTGNGLVIELASASTLPNQWRIVEQNFLLDATIPDGQRVVVSPDGQRVAVNLEDSLVAVYEAGQQNAVIRNFRAGWGYGRESEARSSSVAFGADGRLVAFAIGLEGVVVWDIPVDRTCDGAMADCGYKPLLKVKVPSESAVQVAFAPSGRHLAVVTRVEAGARLRVWDIDHAEVISEATIPLDELEGEGARMALRWDAADTIRRGARQWRFTPAITMTYGPVLNREGFPESADLAFSAKGSFLAMTKGELTEPRVLDLRGLHPTMLALPARSGHLVAVSPDERHLFIGGDWGGAVRPLTSDATVTKTLQTEDPRSLSKVAWTTNGLVAIGRRDEHHIGSVLLATGLPTWHETYNARIVNEWNLHFDPSGTRLLVERTLGRAEAFEERDLATGDITDAGTRPINHLHLEPFHFRGQAALLNTETLAVESLQGAQLAPPRRELLSLGGSAFFSRDGRLYAESRFEDQIVIWDILDPRASPWRIALDGEGTAFDKAFDARGAYFTARVGSSRKVWSTSSRKELGRSDDLPSQTCLAEDGSLRWLDATSGTVTAWHPRDGRLEIVATLQDWPGPGRSEPVLQHCTFVLHEEDQLVGVWDFRNGAKLGRWDNDGTIDTLLVTPDGRSVIELRHERHPIAWNAETGAIWCELPETSGHTWTFSPAGTYAIGLSGSEAPYAYDVVRIDPEGCTQLPGWEHTATDEGVSIADDGLRILHPTMGGALLHDTATKRVVELIDGEDLGTRTTFVPGANLAAVGYARGDVAVWDLDGPRLLYRLPGTGHAVSGLAVGSNADRLALLGSDGTIVVWDLAALRAAIDALPQPLRWWDDVVHGFNSFVGGDLDEER